MEETLNRIRAARKTSFEETVAESFFNGLLFVAEGESRLKKIWPRHSAPVAGVDANEFFSLTGDQLKQYLVWKGGSGAHRRTVLLFDSKTAPCEMRDITVAAVNAVDTALRTCQDDQVGGKKLWFIDRWDRIRSRFFALLRNCEYEQDSLPSRLFVPEGSLAGDEDFYAQAETNKAGLFGGNEDLYKNLLAIRRLMDSWGLFVRRAPDMGINEGRFTVVLDAREKTAAPEEKTDASSPEKAPSAVTVLRNWLDSWDGTPVKQKALLKSLGLKEEALEKAMKKDPELKKRLKEYRKEAEARGWTRSFAKKAAGKSSKKKKG